MLIRASNSGTSTTVNVAATVTDSNTPHDRRLDEQKIYTDYENDGLIGTAFESRTDAPIAIVADDTTPLGDGNQQTDDDARSSNLRPFLNINSFPALTGYRLLQFSIGSPVNETTPPQQERHGA